MEMLTQTDEQFILRTGLGRKVFEGDERSCRAHAERLRLKPGLQPKLVLVRVITLEQDLESL